MMVTSGTIVSNMLVSEIITAAMQELGVIAAGEAPTGEETELAIRSLNWMLKSWENRGLTSWRDTDGSVAFPPGTATMPLTPYCLDVLEARLVQTSTFERPLQRWELGQYRQVPNKQTQGYPTAFSISKTDNVINMTLWPVPSAAMTINYSYPRIIEDVTDGAQAVDCPQEWIETVYLGLASRLAQTLGVTRLDPNTTKAVSQRAATLEQLLLDQDRPASIYMGSIYDRNF